MGPSKHSKTFSPSKSSLWLNCYLSTEFSDGTKEESNEASIFGTQCHNLASYQMSKALKVDFHDEVDMAVSVDDLKKTLTKYDATMQEIADKYTDFIVNTYKFEASKSVKKTLVLIEQQLDLGFDDSSVGRLDFGLISSRDDGTLTIVDLKTGRIPVMAYDKELNRVNSQLGIYAISTYNCFKDVYPIKNIRLVIYQPLINNTNEYELSLDELLKLKEEVLDPAVKAIQGGSKEARVGNWCKYCPNRMNCKKRASSALSLIDLEGDASRLTEEEIGKILSKCDECISFFNDIKEHCLKKAINGYHYDGFKLVHSRVTRKISDEAKVGEILTSAGIDPYAERKLLGITELTRRLGKEKFKELVSPYVSIQEGSLVLVPNSDPRDEVNQQKDEVNSNVKN